MTEFELLGSDSGAKNSDKNDADETAGLGHNNKWVADKVHGFSQCNGWEPDEEADWEGISGGNDNSLIFRESEVLVDEPEPPVKETFYHDESSSKPEGFVLLILSIFVVDIGDLFVHDSIDKEAEVDTDDANEHLEGFLPVNSLQTVGEHFYYSNEVYVQ